MCGGGRGSQSQFEGELFAQHKNEFSFLLKEKKKPDTGHTAIATSAGPELSLSFAGQTSV